MKPHLFGFLLIPRLLPLANAFGDSQLSFTKHQLDNQFRAEGVSAGDIDEDRFIDILPSNKRHLHFPEFQ